MIGSVRGKVILRDGNTIIVETASGVGYRILVSSKVLSENPIDHQAFIYTYTHVKEDILELFGFSEIADLKLFENLISVNGVGPKTAMSVFSVLTREEIIGGVLKGDVNVFSGIPRLGKKNAQKIIIELKNKLGDTSSFDLNGLDSDAADEVYSALQSFGFKPAEIRDALKNVDSKASTPEEKIKIALKYLGK
jgi:holliday junction DNA helicase RuvA